MDQSERCEPTYIKKTHCDPYLNAVATGVIIEALYPDGECKWVTGGHEIHFCPFCGVFLHYFTALTWEERALVVFTSNDPQAEIKKGAIGIIEDYRPSEGFETMIVSLPGGGSGQFRISKFRLTPLSEEYGQNTDVVAED